VHAAVWTGAKMLIWGGTGLAFVQLGDGASYDPAIDAWTSISSVNAPSGRNNFTAVWTGTEMIVWGGSETGSNTGRVNTGGRYDPSTDTWTPIASTTARYGHTVVWTGTEMVVFGGTAAGGAHYNLASDSWTPTSSVGIPVNRGGHSAVWSGTEMLVWGGYNSSF